MRMKILLAALMTVFATSVLALESVPYQSNSLNAKLRSAQDGIASGAHTFSAGLHLELEDGWKTYWRSPGEVGLPPEVDWSASENIASVDFQYPAPTRFRAFGIENFGYAHEVLFPLQVTLENPGEAAVLRGNFSLLVCAEVCIPDAFALELPIGQGEGIDTISAGYIAEAMALVPSEPSENLIARSHMSDQILTLEIRDEVPFQAPDIFPEFGMGSAFGAPDIRLSENGKTLWAEIPILALDDEVDVQALTVVDGERAFTFDALLGEEIPAPPYEISGKGSQTSRIWVYFLALLGGLILNVMPCVLPVLSIKFASALKVRDQSLARVRRGFLASSFGVLTFMWALAAVLLLMRGMGQTVGWGLQFQSPIFLVTMLAVLTVFAANMLGLFEISLPQSWMTRMNATGTGSGYIADFSTGALAAVLATPCSAPFLGTAVAFALAGSTLDVLGIFTALGIGLSAPYLLVALRPSLIRALPKPGRWMITVKFVLGLLLVATALWLASVLATVSGVKSAGLVLLLLVGLVLVLTFGQRVKAPVSIAIFLAALGVPLALSAPEQTTYASSSQIEWQKFDRGEIPRLVASGKTVFVDATADWCLTCKANKKLVLTQGKVAEVLQQENVVPMIADWTRQDEDIARFLRSNGRFGVPFNIVYGPAAPDGIALPELLTSDIVLDAFKQAEG
ncbi:protein-disulfide reductase DsbD family protein [Falsihalocynthiibacter sp. BN13B15]|uniref:protein-disulfide reductase DsbD family protein n=1 Tax=Falsihalocynthiibacter sp. BN13B15 TaxID=3240871 RepID=UPI00350F689F